jgi:SOS-response transcriptional repressor LexA
MHTVWNMPVRHAGGGDFDILQYDQATKSIVMDASLWRELCLTGNWIQDATVLRWAELTEQINGGAVKASRMIDCLLTVPDAKRNVEDARRYYLSQAERTCVWTERAIPREFAVDHAIPFALWRNNDLWNLLPASVEANNRKSDRLPTYELLQLRRDLIIHCWRGLDEALGERFRREAQSLLGADALPAASWETKLFSRFVEAFETTAAQRGAARWEPTGLMSRRVTPNRIILADLAPYPKTDERLYLGPSAISAEKVEVLAGHRGPKAKAERDQELRLFRFDEIGPGAFSSYLPVAASLAAGLPFHGFETENLAVLEEFDWIEVPERLAKERRFVVRVSGDSMEPTLHFGDLVVFEYHRTPRRQGEIVIANLPEFGSATGGTEAIKRFREEPDRWVFESDNPEYEAIWVEKDEIEFPILGTMVGVLR